MADVWKSPCGRMELRLGRWQDVLADVTECDAVITDPPYSERTHTGQRTGSSIRAPTILYDPMTQKAASDLAEWISGTRAHWTAIWSDHIAQAWHENALQDCGWYVFAPLPWIKHPAPPRMSGDGPCCASEHLTIARPKKRLEAKRVGSRRGWYLARGRMSCDPKAGIAGVKDLGTVRELLTDYTLPGDFVVDCYAGLGTTLLAAAIEGRRAIGAECDPETYAKAVRRLSKGYTPAMVFDRKPKPKQATLI